MADLILRYPGSKWNLAKWIIGHMPKHDSYLEPFIGSGAVFFNKPKSKLETINDIDSNVVNLFQTLRERPEELIKAIELTPWSREEYLKSYEPAQDDLENARRFIIRCWQAFGTKTSGKTGWRNDVQGLQGTSVSNVWVNVPDRIKKVVDRLKGVQIENLPAVDVIKRFNYSNVLIYADPPYPLSTRSGKMYAKEMTDHDHLELLKVLDQHKGPVILSGYSCDLYDNNLKQWQKKTVKATADGGREREEVIWLNKVASEYSYSLFEIEG